MVVVFAISRSGGGVEEVIAACDQLEYLPTHVVKINFKINRSRSGHCQERERQRKISTHDTSHTPNVCTRPPLGTEYDFRTAVLPRLYIIREMVFRPSRYTAHVNATQRLGGRGRSKRKRERKRQRKEQGKENTPFPKSAILTVILSIPSSTLILVADVVSAKLLLGFESTDIAEVESGTSVTAVAAVESDAAALVEVEMAEELVMVEAVAPEEEVEAE